MTPHRRTGGLYLVQDLLPPVRTHGLAPEQVGTTQEGEHLDPDLQWQPRQASVLEISDHRIRDNPLTTRLDATFVMTHSGAEASMN